MVLLEWQVSRYEHGTGGCEIRIDQRVRDVCMDDEHGVHMNWQGIDTKHDGRSNLATELAGVITLAVLRACGKGV